MSRSHCPRFGQGLEVHFGSISISSRGIRSNLPSHSGKTLSWAAIRSYSATNGYLVIHTASGESLCFLTSRIPNLAVLLHAFEQLVPRKGNNACLEVEESACV
jgi:hypothetical protein